VQEVSGPEKQESAKLSLAAVLADADSVADAVQSFFRLAVCESVEKPKFYQLGLSRLCHSKFLQSRLDLVLAPAT